VTWKTWAPWQKALLIAAVIYVVVSVVMFTIYSLP
jgi:hypothetical protein